MASSMASLGVAVSGLKAAQVGLSTTGHNVTNAEITGYTRQQAIQQFSTNVNLGTCPSGSGLLQQGLGTDVSAIRQIRNKFFDIKYRDANTVAGYFAVKYETGNEIENIIGELESDYKAQDVINDIWDAVNELTIYPDGIETRTGFIETCVTFMDKIKNIGDNLYEYQLNLNEQVKDCVAQINSIVSQINELNQKIVGVEMTGDRANDYRDERNNLLDELSGLSDIIIKENGEGRVDILTGNGDEVLVNGFQSLIGLRYCNGDYPFVEPVFTRETDILPADNTTAKALYKNIAVEDLRGEMGNTNGKLKGLLASRGEDIANYNTPDADVNNFLIPKIQQKIDKLFHAVVVMINDTVRSTPDSPKYDLKGDESTTEIFSRITGLADNPYIDRDVEEDINDFSTYYSMYNVEINAKILETDGYNYLAFASEPNNLSDPTVLNDLSSRWKRKAVNSKGEALLEDHSIDSFYRAVITDFGIEVEEALNYSEAQTTMLDTIENDRRAISGVSLDEELTSMLKYQHAYNAAARMVTIIDSMIDKVVNGTGRVGL